MRVNAAFTAACRTLSRDLQSLPAAVRAALPEQMMNDVARPLAETIARKWTGPHAAALAAATQARYVRDDLEVFAGGRTRLISGGATGRDLVWGNEFGGGNRVKSMTSSRGKSYRRHTTRQFGGGSDTLLGTADAALDWMLEQTARAAGTIIDKVLRNG